MDQRHDIHVVGPQAHQTVATIEPAERGDERLA
jgi:hypothetical protein